MYLLLGLAYLSIASVFPPLFPFSNINSISGSVNNSNFIPVFFKQASHANPGKDKKLAGSNSYSLRHKFLKFLNTSASNNASL